jgi:glycine cleavage system aminomethyltransferase T
MYKTTSIENNPSVPDDPRVIEFVKLREFLKPTYYCGWIPETLSWKQTAYLSANLSAEMPCLYVKGPDALRLLNENCVNNFTKLAIGAARHAIMCSEKGHILCHGMVLRFSENNFGTYALQPLIVLLANSGKYKVEPISMDIYDFIYQVAGPKSLEILEQAAQEDLHDIKFSHFRDSQIAGHKVRITRIGMAGTLAYEVHGPLEISHEVYNTIYEAGKPLGMEKLGVIPYSSNHTENGFPQSGMHFLYAWQESPELYEFLAGSGYSGPQRLNIQLKGSLSNDVSDYYRNPIELGWESMIKFDHDFVGRKELEKIVASPHRQIVTLVWNPEDIADVFASYFRTNDKPYKLIKFPRGDINENYWGSSQDRVMDQKGNTIGKSSSPVYTMYFRKLISLCSIEPEYTQIGKEVTVVWGNKDDRKKNIRATVERFPILDLVRNRDFDLETIPHFKNSRQ